MKHIQQNQISASGTLNEITAASDHSSVKENTNICLFASETDLLTKAYLIVDLLRSAKLDHNRFTDQYGIEINSRLNKISFTAEEIISCCKNCWGVEITKEQILFIFRHETNCYLFKTHSIIGQDKQSKIISYSYWFTSLEIFK